MPALPQLLALALLLVATLPPSVRAHTWVEEFQAINENGTYFGDRGFSRGYMARTDPGFNGDSNLWMLPSLDARMPDGTVRSRINGSDLMCHPSQRSQNYTTYPMLKATPGSYIAAKYLENGHVTLPWNNIGKPTNGGTVLIYGTTQPDMEGEKVVNVLKWTKDMTGGDKRGFLMGQMDYDDGECHQINSCVISNKRQIWYPNGVPGQSGTSIERWCESDIKIPENVAPGKLTVYWIWDWGTNPGEDCLAPEGRDQYYTNCADWEIIAGGGDAASGNAKNAAAPAAPTLAQQDPNTRAVKNFASRTAVNSWALTTAVAWADFSNNKVAAASPAQNSSFLAYCSSKVIADQASVAADPAAAAAPAASCASDKYAPTGAAFSSWSASIKAQGPPTVNAAPATSTPATSAPPAAAPSAPAPVAPAPTSPAVAPSASAPTPAPPAPSSAQADTGFAWGAVVTITETQVSISTLTTYVATPPAASIPAASGPALPAANPPAASAAAVPAPVDPNAAAYPTVSVISNVSAGMTASAAPSPAGSPNGAPYAADSGPNGKGGDHRPPPRRHARHFRETT